MEWTKDKIIKLIKLYEERPCLWNVVLEDHKDSVKKKAAWQEVAAEMGLHFMDVERKMKSILAQYRRERRKWSEPTDGQPRWFAYQYLTFLNAVNRSRRTVESLLFKELQAQGYKVEYPAEGEDDDDIKVPFEVVSNDKKSKNETETFKIEIEADDDDDMDEKVPILFIPTHTENKKRKRFKHQQTQYSGVTETEIGPKEDTFDHYGKYIASVLRCLPLQKAFKLQQTFSQLLLEEQLNACETTDE